MPIAAVLLEFIDGPEKGRTVRIAELGPTLIGRGTDADVRLPAVDGAVSRHQAYIDLSRDRCVLTPVTAANRIVEVNHTPLRAARLLEDGDVVCVGSTILRVGLTMTDASCLLCGKPVDCPSEPTRDEHADINTLAHEGCVDRFVRPRTVLGDGEVGPATQEGTSDVVSQLYERSTRRLWATRWVSLKSAERFDADVQTLLAIRHMNIIRCIRAGRHADRGYIVTEIARGGCLADHVSRDDHRSDTVVTLMHDVLDALAFLHSVGRPHGNVHPRSIVVQHELRGSGTRFRAKLVDIGVSCRVRSGIPTATTLNGYPPEHDAAAPDPRADVYAAAATLSFLLGARFAGRPSTEPRATISKRIATVLDRARHRDPTRRFRSVRQFQDALREATHGV